MQLAAVSVRARPPVVPLSQREPIRALLSKNQISPLEMTAYPDTESPFLNLSIVFNIHYEPRPSAVPSE